MTHTVELTTEELKAVAYALNQTYCLRGNDWFGSDRAFLLAERLLLDCQTDLMMESGKQARTGLAE